MTKHLIEPPKEFFELKYLTRLWNIFNDALKEYTTSKDIQLSPIAISRMANGLLKHGVDPRQIKTLDVGSGGSFLLGAFAVHGCPVYGIEANGDLISPSIDILKRLPYKVMPHIIEANYYDYDIFEKQFNDGTKFQDIDFFYSYSFGSEHARRLLMRILAGENKAKIGSMACLLSLEENEAFLEGMGFRTHSILSDAPKLVLIEKVKSVNLSFDEINSLDLDTVNIFFKERKKAPEEE